MEVGLVVLGFVLSLIGQFATRELSKKDKADEQYEARLDRYRDNLRLALSEFCGAATNLVDRGVQFAAIELAINRTHDEARDMFQRAGYSGEQLTMMMESSDRIKPDMITRSRQAFEDFLAAASHAEARAVSVLLLINDDEVREDISFIAVRQYGMPTDTEQCNQFDNDIRARRARLDELIRKLSSLFVPEPRTTDQLDDPARSQRLLR